MKTICMPINFILVYIKRTLYSNSSSSSSSSSSNVITDRYNNMATVFPEIKHCYINATLPRCLSPFMSITEQSLVFFCTVKHHLKSLLSWPLQSMEDPFHSASCQSTYNVQSMHTGNRDPLYLVRCAFPHESDCRSIKKKTSEWP